MSHVDRDEKENDEVVSSSPMQSPARSLLSRLHTGRSPLTSSVHSNPNTQPFTHGLEMAGENAPYYVGTKDVTLADKYIKDDGCHRLVQELLGRGTDLAVTTIDLRGNDIRRYGAEALGELLRENSSVETLNLEWNFLGDSGGSGLEMLCDALKTNRTLTSLDLRNNRLNSECGIHLARLLICNPTLQHLDLRWNNLCSVGGQAIADSLIRNHYIRSIALSGNRIPSSIIKAIEEALAKNRQVDLKRGNPSDLEKDPQKDFRQMEQEQLIHDLRRDIHHLQNQNRRNEEELKLADENGDKLLADKTALQSQLDKLQEKMKKVQLESALDLERTAADLVESNRERDQISLELKKALLDLTSSQNEVKILKEDRNRLILSKESLNTQLSQEIEKLQNEIHDLNQAAHAREKSFAVERQDIEKAHQHARKQLELEKDNLYHALQEKYNALSHDYQRERQLHKDSVDSLSGKMKGLMDSSGDSHSSARTLQEKLVALQLQHEETLSRLEKLHRQELLAERDRLTREFEGRILALNSDRDELSNRGEEGKKQLDALIALLDKERVEHSAALEKERNYRSQQAHASNEAQKELFSLRAKLLEMNHQVGVLTSTVEANAQTEQELRHRHQEQMEELYHKSKRDLESMERKYAKTQEENSRLRSDVKMLQLKLDNLEAAQNIRSQNLMSALSALKSSVSEVDHSVRHDLPERSSSHSHSRHHHHHSSSRVGDDSSRHHHHHDSHRTSSSSRRPHATTHSSDHHSSSHSEKERERERDRDRDRNDRDRHHRDRDRDRDDPASPSSHRHSHHHHSSSSTRRHHSSSSNHASPLPSPLPTSASKPASSYLAAPTGSPIGNVPSLSQAIAAASASASAGSTASSAAPSARSARRGSDSPTASSRSHLGARRDDGSNSSGEGHRLAQSKIVKPLELGGLLNRQAAPAATQHLTAQPQPNMQYEQEEEVAASQSYQQSQSYIEQSHSQSYLSQSGASAARPAATVIRQQIQQSQELEEEEPEISFDEEE